MLRPPITCDKCGRRLQTYRDCEACRLESRLKPYGLPYEEYVRIRAEQSNKCMICEYTPSGVYPDVFCIDHDHQFTDKTVIRGLLCQFCNQMIGRFRDDARLLQNAITYLAGTPQYVSEKQPRPRYKKDHFIKLGQGERTTEPFFESDHDQETTE